MKIHVYFIPNLIMIIHLNLIFKALKYISTRMKISSKQFSSNQFFRRNRIDEARELLAHIILAHVPVSSYISKQNSFSFVLFLFNFHQRSLNIIIN